MTKTASDRQVGGSHYSANMQHWDFLPKHCNFGAEYYIGCATKYITRHAKKNGRQDLEKAMHFIEKLIELASGGYRTKFFPSTIANIESIHEYCRANGLQTSSRECFAFVMLFQATVVSDYVSAKKYVQDILDTEYAVGAVTNAESAVGGDTLPMLHNPPVPAPGFVWEGQSGDREFYQCMRCGEHVTAAENVPPASVHRCAMNHRNG